MSLAGKVAVVTGASSGIGAAIAVKLTEDGAQVVIIGRNEVKLNNVSAKCEKLGHKPLSIIADVSKEEDAKKIITDTIQTYGKLDILVNNAGIGFPASILDENAMNVFQKVMATNLQAPVLLTHLAAKYLIETKGNIVNISSAAALKVISSTGFSYSTSKAALDHFSRCIAYELAPKGVRVNVVSPGPVRTDILENIGGPADMVDKMWENIKGATILGRIAEPEEIADLVAFLVSDKARSITGSTIVSDNGAMFKGPSENLTFKFD